MFSLSVSLIGGLGNQLFQFFSAYSIAKTLRREFVVDISTFNTYKVFPPYLNQFFDLFEFSISSTSLSPLLWRIPFYCSLRKESSIGFDPSLFRPTRRSHIHLSGYLQSLHYFLPNLDIIRSKFIQQLDKDKEYYSFMSNLISNHTVLGVHIRGGDKLRSNVNCSIYGTPSVRSYHQSIEAAISHAEKPPLIVCFTDDRSFANSFLNHLEVPHIFSPESFSAWDDFCALSMSSSIIFSNSTFALWASYLAVNQNALIYHQNPFYNTPYHSSVTGHLDSTNILLPFWNKYK